MWHDCIMANTVNDADIEGVSAAPAAYLGSPIDGVTDYNVVELGDEVHVLAGPLPWVVARLEAGYLAHTHPSSDIEIWAAT